MELVAKGLTNPEICSVLSISTSTAKVHLAAILRALDVSNRTEAAARWAEWSLAPAPADDRFAPMLIVLPFPAYSVDPGDEALAAGLTEDVTSRVGRLPGVSVVGRGSAVALFGSGAKSDARRAHQEFGVRYALEGSVRRNEARLRVRVRLLDAKTGTQLWTESWDRTDDELFDLEDELVAGIASQLSTELVRAEARRAEASRPGSVGAWENYQRAVVAFYYDGYGQENAERALALIERALSEEPDYAYALAFRSTLLSNRVAHGWAEEPEREAEAALASGHRALALAPDDPQVLQHWGSTLSVLDDPAKAILPLQRAVEADPSSAHSWAVLGLYHARSGALEEAARHLARAFALSPQDPRRYLWHTYKGVAAIVAGDYERVIDQCRAALAMRRDLPMCWAISATLLAHIGRSDEAHDAAREALALETPRPFRNALGLLRLHRPEDEWKQWREVQATAGFVDPDQ
jgi:TolB-like protein